MSSDGRRAMGCAMLAPKAEVSIYPWKEPEERIPLAVRQGTFLPEGASACLKAMGWSAINQSM
jgi:hypothetical protein